MPKLTENSSAAVEDELAESFPQHSTFVDALAERLTKKTKRSRLLVMRVSNAEHAALKHASQNAGASISDIIRYALSLCLTDGVLDSVAKQHLATVKRTSRPDRNDVRQNRKTMRASSDDELETKVSEDLGAPLPIDVNVPEAAVVTEDPAVEEGARLEEDIIEEL